MVSNHFLVMLTYYTSKLGHDTSWLFGIEVTSFIIDITLYTTIGLQLLIIILLLTEKKDEHKHS